MNTELIEETKRKTLELFKNHKFGVISTVDEEGGKPESALVGFAEKDTFEIIFGTLNTSRKYKNLQKNPRISFVVGWDAQTGSVQYEGVVKEISGEEQAEAARILLEKNPFAKKFAEKPEQRWFLVTPKWIRFVDHVGETGEIAF